jgi:hypothetical protein
LDFLLNIVQYTTLWTASDPILIDGKSNLTVETLSFFDSSSLLGMISNLMMEVVKIFERSSQERSMGSPDGVNPNTIKYVKISLVRFKIRVNCKPSEWLPQPL